MSTAYKHVGTRESFVQGIVAAADRDASIALVSSDSLKALRADPFKERFPRRFFEVGIAEQTAVAFAAGLAAAGMLPFVGTYAGFLTMRAAEQMRTFVAYPNLTAKFVGLNGGLYGGEREGVTHQFFEDLGILRTIPGYEVVVPCDGPQTAAATVAMARRPGPGYIRVGSGKEPVILGDTGDFTIGKARVVSNIGRDLAIFTCGPALRLALEAAEQLKKQGVQTTVVEVHTLKPLDTDTITAVLNDVGVAVTLEDHNVIGGLGSAIAETAADYAPKRILRMGIPDTYPVSGEREELWEHFGFTVSNVVNTCRGALA